ncbi:MAG: ABC transporter permease [Gemmatimonadetes bacterium]|nr:ABC transporter permease [Gemmatimonadota bacterium]
MRPIRALLRDGRAVIGLAILAVLAGVAVLAPILAPADPLAQHDILRTRLLAPLSVGPDQVTHWLGTDRLGRDLFARLLYGARISLAVGLLSVAVSLLIGGAVGLVAALAGGIAERALMAVTDAALMLPRIVLLLSLVALWEPSLALVVLVLGFTGWMTIARLARAEAKAVLARPFVEAARAAGVGGTRLLWRHVLPNAVAPLLVATALGVGNAITLEAGLSFLGLGVPAPAPSWGNLIASGRDSLVNAPWIATFPGLAVVLAVVACNLLADGIQDALDPQRRASGTVPSG